MKQLRASNWQQKIVFPIRPCLNKTTFDTSNSGVELAMASLKSANAQRQLARLALADTEVRSPMGPLSLCIGLLIDDAIVVRENIVRHLRMGKSHRRAAEDDTNEIGLAVMATTFAIVAVLVSLFVSFTLDPMLSSVWHDPAENRFKRFPWLARMMEKIEHGIEKLHQIYGTMMSWFYVNERPYWR